MPAVAPAPTRAPAARSLSETAPAPTQAAPTPAPRPRRVPESHPDPEPRVSLDHLKPPASTDPRLPDEFKFPGEPDLSTQPQTNTSTKPAEPRLALHDAAPPPNGRKPTAMRSAQLELPVEPPKAVPEPEPVLTQAAPERFDEGPRIDDPADARERRNAPSAALEMPTPSRALRNLIAAIAVIVVIAIGVSAFVAVVMTAPDSPQQASAIDRFATRALERLETWGLTRP
jgi:hypothetical protein